MARLSLDSVLELLDKEGPEDEENEIFFEGSDEEFGLNDEDIEDVEIENTLANVSPPSPLSPTMSPDSSPPTPLLSNLSPPLSHSNSPHHLVDEQDEPDSANR